MRLTPRDDLDALPVMSQQYGCQRKPAQDNNNIHDNRKGKSQGAPLLHKELWVIKECWAWNNLSREEHINRLSNFSLLDWEKIFSVLFLDMNIISIYLLVFFFFFKANPLLGKVTRYMTGIYQELITYILLPSFLGNSIATIDCAF